MKLRALGILFLICLSLSVGRHIIVHTDRPLSQASQDRRSLDRDSIDVTLEVETTEPEPNQLRVGGKTNLPDGFVMQVSACRLLVSPAEASSAKFTRGICGAGTYYEIQRVKVTEGSFITWFDVPTVEAARKIQLDYVEQSGDSQRSREFVPWEFVLVAVDGYPGLQPDDILPIIGGSEGHNLAGAHVHKHRNTAPGQDEDPYNYVTWETNLKM